MDNTMMRTTKQTDPRRATAFVALIHMNEGWVYVGMAHDSSAEEDIGHWPTLEAAIAGMKAAGYRYAPKLSNERFTRFVGGRK